MSFFCGFIVGFAVICWMLIPDMAHYRGGRYSPETGRMLLISATAIVTAFLPLVAWHGWNFMTRPGALYAADGRLYIYWAWFQVVAISEIADVDDLGRATWLSDSVRLTLRDGRQVKFQTTFMADRGATVATAIRRIAGLSAL